MKPSIYQEKIFEHIAENKSNLVINALAGTGKTSTIIKALDFIPPDKKVLFVAFNKRIVTELTDKITRPNTYIKTYNGLGFGTLRGVTLDNNKIFNLITDYEKKIPESYRVDNDTKIDIVKLIGLAKSYGFVPRDMFLNGIEIDHTDLVELADSFNIELFNKDDPENDNVITYAYAILKKSIELENVIDFNDQIYFPVIHGKRFMRYDYVFNDELQDISYCQRMMMINVANGCRFVGVGDPNQAIYQFRGADHNSMSEVVKAFNADVLGLPINYRCGKSIIREAQKFVPKIEAFEHSSEGTVDSIKNLPSNLGSGDMILHPFNAPLVETCYELMQDGVRAKILGKDISAGILRIIKKSKAKNKSDLIHKMKLEIIEESKREKPKLDNYETVIVFARNSEAETIEGLTQEVKDFFSDDYNEHAVTLSTIHKSKGLESDRVFILPFPKKIVSNNLQYVAVTRAKKELYFVMNGSY